MRSPLIVKSNELIEARYRLSLGEQRLILLLVGQISPDDVDFKDYQIRVVDFAKMFDLETTNRVYEMVEQAAQSLVGRKLELTGGGKKKRFATWLSYVEYVEGSGVVEMRFDKSLKPYLLQLKKQFTQYQLKRVVHFKSQYSIRLYEFLKAEEFKAKDGYFKRTLEVDELRAKFCIPEDEYKLFKNFRVRVIEPAVKEINKHSDLRVIQVDYAKVGTKVTHIVFHVEKSAQQELNLETGSPVVEEARKKSPAELAMLEFGIGALETEKLLKKHSGAKIMRNLLYTQSQKAVRDKHKYFYTCLERDAGKAWEEEELARLERKKKAMEATARQTEKTEQEIAAKSKLIAEANSWFNALSPEEQLKLTKRFDQENPPPPVNSKSARANELKTFIRQQYEKSSK